ncbi:MAG: hypothetical protein ABIJ16_13015 [Bacteroidota bacterium]
MKRLLTVLVAMAIVLPLVVTSCKKGEEDPFLSLKSRDKRLVGEWVLKSIEASSTDNYNNNYSGTTSTQYQENETRTVTYDGSKETTVVTTSYKSVGSQTFTCSTTHTYYDVYTMNVTIDKGGMYTMVYTYPNNTNAGSFVITSSPSNSGGAFGVNNPYDYNTNDGTYNQTINNDYSSSQTGDETGHWYWMDTNKNKSAIYIDGMGMYEILELKSKEMKLKYMDSSNSTDTDTYTGTGAYTDVDTDADTYEEILTFEKQ